MGRYEDFKKNKLNRIFSELVEKFPTERACINEVLAIRKHKQGSLCQTCNESENLMFLWGKKKVRCKKCGKETAFAFGTIFYNSKVPIVTWFRLIWLWSRSPFHSNAKKFGEELGLPRSTTLECMQKIRRMFTSNYGVLCGSVECDLLNLHSGSLAAYYALAVNQKMICVAVHARTNGAGQVHMEMIEDFSLEQYSDFRRRHLGENTTEKRGGLLLSRINREPIKHKATIGDTKEYSTLPSVNRISDKLDKWLWENFHGAVISSDYLREYLNEFCFRWNNRYDEKGKKSKAYLFEQVLERAVYGKDTIEEENGGKEIELPEGSHSIPEKVG